jgi:hypothetical protein
MNCYICHEPIGKHATTVGVHDLVAHFDCAQKHPEAFARMMGCKKPKATSAEGEECPNCKGDGQFYHGDPESPEVAQCERCEGTGRLSTPSPKEVPMAMLIAIKQADLSFGGEAGYYKAREIAARYGYTVKE